MKTKKSLTKRLKITKNGKILARKPGFNHFNAKQSRTSQLAGRKTSNFKISNKDKAKFLPFN
ncbi:MAG: 50S ribosomal protein L35 [Candidatus Paceibacterota bacterium]|jgi:ribosomal protein L35